MGSLLAQWQRLEWVAFEAINRRITHPFFDGLMALLSSEMLWQFLAVAIVILLLALKKLRYRMFFFFCFAIAATDILCYWGLKQNLQRMRPCYQKEDVRLLEPRCGSDYGLPSNHAANSAATAVYFYLHDHKRRRSLLLFLLAALVGYSRVYLGVHFLGDILLGFFVGSLMGWFFYWQSTKMRAA